MTELNIVYQPPKIKLYESGFEGLCQYGRSKEGTRLSDIVERSTSPLVIAVDGPWGCGKSFFLKCWVGEHAKNEAANARTVYFDAFEDDFMDNPLVGLVSAVSRRFEPEVKTSRAWKMVKDTATKLALPATRVALAVGSAGLTEIAPVVMDAVTTSSVAELEKGVEAFWKNEDGKRAAMETFRSQLTEFAQDQKLVIVVDELDRCRPDYALNLLETVKHFFDVPNVHFVLGVNLSELRNSVKARYGANIQADKYLQKFITVRMPLTLKRARNQFDHALLHHLGRVCGGLELEETWKYDRLRELLPLVRDEIEITFRDIERIATLARVTPGTTVSILASGPLEMSIVILQVIAPHLIEKARRRTLSLEDIRGVFELPTNSDPENRSVPEQLFWIWQFAIEQEGKGIDDNVANLRRAMFDHRPPNESFMTILRDTVDTFKVF